MNYDIITLKKGRSNALNRKHPWIFSGAIYKKAPSVKAGDIVYVLDEHQNILATGHYNDASIAVRILAFNECQIDEVFYTKRIQEAIESRKAFPMLPSKTTNCYRLIAGEGDFLPGLIIDIYNDNAVIQCHSLGMLKQIEFITKALDELLDLKTIYLKSIHVKSSEYKSKFLKGNESGCVVVENGVLFKVDWVTGQKTGFFLDQRENRSLLGQLSKGKRILNTFCYTGGFSAYAIKAGAEFVHSVDISESAIALTDENIELNNSDANHKSDVANVLNFLKENDLSAYDIIVLDPPAFAKNRNKTHNAIQAYKRLNALALKSMSTGTLLMTFSCSQLITPELFEHTIRSAAITTGRKIRILQHLQQGADHCINIYHEEGHYLKGLLLIVTD